MRINKNGMKYLAWRIPVMTALLCACVARPASADPLEAKTVPAKALNESEYLLMFDLLPSERCNFGDLDVILNDLRTGNDDMRLQLSVETIGANRPMVSFGTPLEKKLSEKNLGTYRVAIPKPTETTIYGVFLCTVPADELSKTPCSQQRLLSFQEMVKPYTVVAHQKSYKGPQKVEPKVYFAQFLLGGPTSFSTLSTEADLQGAPDFQKLGISQGNADKEWTIIKNFSSTLGSLPLESADERLQLVLPFFSDKKYNFNPTKN